MVAKISVDVPQPSLCAGLLSRSSTGPPRGVERMVTAPAEVLPQRPVRVFADAMLPRAV